MIGSRPPILIFGSPRSGTSWIGSIFDTHPDTLYRHEPDTVLRGDGLPYTFAADDLDRHVPAARRYLEQLFGVTAARANSLLPQFKKSYRGRAGQALRLGLIYTHKLIEQVAKSPTLDRRLRIPDIVSRRERVVPVLKSVDSLGRLPLFARALDDCRIVLIVRHPCGMVSSKLRGHKLGEMGKPVAYRDWLRLPLARERGLTSQSLQALTPVQIAAHQWLLFNDYVLRELQDDPRLRVLIYDDFCRDPHAGAAELLRWAGLEYGPRTRAFIDLSLNYRGPSPRYFQIVRNPLEASLRWRQELDATQQQEIAGVVHGTAAGALFYDEAY